MTNARWVTALFIGRVKRTEMSTPGSTPSVPARGRKRTTVGATIVSTTSGWIAATGAPSVSTSRPAMDTV